MSEDIRERRFEEKRHIALTGAINLFEQLNDVLMVASADELFFISQSLSLTERAINKLQPSELIADRLDRINENVIGATFQVNARGCLCVVACKVNAHEPDVMIWRAYISVVPGESEDHDIAIAKAWGNTLQERIARAYFPQFKDYEYSKSTMVFEL